MPQLPIILSQLFIYFDLDRGTKLMALKNGSVVDRKLLIYPRIKAQATLKATNQRHLDIDRERRLCLPKWLEYG